MKKLLFAGVAMSAITAFGASASADITIAVAGPMTGQYAAFGEQMKAARKPRISTHSA